MCYAVLERWFCPVSLHPIVYNRKWYLELCFIFLYFLYHNSFSEIQRKTHYTKSHPQVSIFCGKCVENNDVRGMILFKHWRMQLKNSIKVKLPPNPYVQCYINDIKGFLSLMPYCFHLLNKSLVNRVLNSYTIKNMIILYLLISLRLLSHLTNGESRLVLCGVWC